MLMVFFRDHVAHFVNKGWVKAMIILIFAAYLGGACYGLTQIQEGLERRKLSKADSYSVKFFDLEDDYYREFPYRIQVIITGDLNYSDPLTQMQIEDSMQRLENTSYVTSSIYTESWLRTFLSFVERSEYLNISVSTEQEFIDALKEVKSFLASYATAFFSPQTSFSFSIGFTLEILSHLTSSLTKTKRESKRRASLSRQST